MVVVVFEVELKESEASRYFDIAADLRPELDGIDGFISVERFSSLTTPNRYVSLSFWRDAEAVQAWRRNARHRAAQQEGRAAIFADFRITVAEALRSYRMHDAA